MNFAPLIKAFPGVFERYWNNKWPQSKIMYKTDSLGLPIDIRSVFNHSNESMEVLAKDLMSRHKGDALALAILYRAAGTIKYVSDKAGHGRVEFWQTSSETQDLKAGDCEDGAIWISDMLHLCGIPYWRFKLCAGYVEVDKKPVGHAYVIYLADDLKWYVLDWCYWAGLSTAYFKVKEQSERKEYAEIWFTANAEKSWAQKDVDISKVWKDWK